MFYKFLTLMFDTENALSETFIHIFRVLQFHILIKSFWNLIGYIRYLKYYFKKM